MNTEWITDRLPKEEDLFGFDVWVTNTNGVVEQWYYGNVKPGTPWQRIHVTEPYVKPKRWTVEWHPRDLGWKLWDWDFPLFILQGLTEDDAEAAQRIADIYNEVNP